MFRFLMILISLGFFCNVANAKMPFYEDDDETKHCLKISNDWDNCTREANRRDLNKVKLQYRSLLSNQDLSIWNEDLETNKTMLRDMYESWTAFRNRLCSLSKVASRYIAPLMDEEQSCNHYYILHHNDHLNSVMQLLGNDPLPDDFYYLTIWDHDDEYDTCVTKRKNVKICEDEELKRSTKAIKDFYNSLINNEFVGRWNNGPDLKNGNYRDMFDSWIAYRNRMCSLSVAVYKKARGEESMTLNHCILFFNREKYETMLNLLVTANSVLDPDDYDDSSNDGGAAEGAKITPLKRRIQSGLDNFDNTLTGDDTKKTEQTSAQDETNSETSRPIPSWAKKR